MKIKVAKAHPYTGERLPNVSIEICEHPGLKKKKDLNDVKKLYEEQGKTLCEVLTQYLPGGTVDQLLIALMQYKATLFKTPLGVIVIFVLLLIGCTPLV